MSTWCRTEEWAVWLAEHRQSGLSVKEFCELIEVSVATFYNWQRKLGKQAQVEIQHGENVGSLIGTSFKPHCIRRQFHEFRPLSSLGERRLHTAQLKQLREF